MLKNFFKAFVFVTRIGLRNLWKFLKLATPVIIFTVVPPVLTYFIIKVTDISFLWAFLIVLALYILEAGLSCFVEYVYSIAKYAQKHNCDIAQAYEAVNTGSEDDDETKSKTDDEKATVHVYYP